MNRERIVLNEYSGSRKQQGVALIVGMIILLILTLIGITAVRSTTQQERMTAATQQQAQSFEAAESAIHYVISQVLGDAGVPTADPTLYPQGMLKKAVDNNMNPQGYPEAATPVLSTTNSVTNSVITVTPTNADSNISASANLYWVNTSCPGYTGVNLNKFSPYGFIIDATASEPGTGTTVRNIQQVCYLAPKT